MEQVLERVGFSKCGENHFIKENKHIVNLTLHIILDKREVNIFYIEVKSNIINEQQITVLKQEYKKLKNLVCLINEQGELNNDRQRKN